MLSSPQNSHLLHWFQIPTVCSTKLLPPAEPCLMRPRHINLLLFTMSTWISQGCLKLTKFKFNDIFPNTHLSPKKKKKKKEKQKQKPYNRGHQPPGCRPVLVHDLLGTGPYSRRWVAAEWAKLHLPLPIARITTWTIASITGWTPPAPPQSLEKVSSTKLVPGAKKLDTAALKLRNFLIILSGTTIYCPSQTTRLCPWDHPLFFIF